jgi:hypothetical protein
VARRKHAVPDTCDVVVSVRIVSGVEHANLRINLDYGLGTLICAVL